MPGRRATVAEEAAWWEKRGRELGLSVRVDKTNFRFDYRVTKDFVSTATPKRPCLNCGQFWEGHHNAHCICPHEALSPVLALYTYSPPTRRWK